MRMGEKLAAKAVSAGAIDKRDAEIYAYSYKMLFMMALLWVSAIVTGFVFGQVGGMLLFMLCFVPLREFSGGIHIKSKLFCYIGTVIVFALVAGGVHAPFIHVLRNVLLVLAPLSCAALFILAPQEDENKPASANEYRHFKKMARSILSAELVLILAAVLFVKSPDISYFCLCGLHLCAILVTIKAIHKK